MGIYFTYELKMAFPFNPILKQIAINAAHDQVMMNLQIFICLSHEAYWPYWLFYGDAMKVCILNVPTLSLSVPFAICL